ncbi:porin family protein [Solitalea sp. MAHUQ-68]|uniref:Porin family protein n=1 Tax=Solitalea agri TaxID=2953739 RepID=A0A9X2JBB3_9SPHI|nr:OmpW family outer membrane protein [Solitalea agri]MCO4291848.1 porin family protein [Solitalea agri]
MKFIYKTLSLALIVCLLSSSAMAQYKYYVNFSWNTALPMSPTSDYISKFSVRGVGFEWGGFVKPNVSLSFQTGWNVFYQAKNRQTYIGEGGGAVTGTPYNYINALPIYGKANYYFKDPASSKTTPYVGIGVGTTWQKQNTDFGITSFYRDGWMFGLYPELGVEYNINPISGINFNVRYNYNFETDQVNELSYLGFNIGFVYRY